MWHFPVGVKGLKKTYFCNVKTRTNKQIARVIAQYNQLLQSFRKGNAKSFSLYVKSEFSFVVHKVQGISSENQSVPVPSSFVEVNQGDFKVTFVYDVTDWRQNKWNHILKSFYKSRRKFFLADPF